MTSEDAPGNNGIVAGKGGEYYNSCSYAGWEIGEWKCSDADWSDMSGMAYTDVTSDVSVADIYKSYSSEYYV